MSKLNKQKAVTQKKRHKTLPEILRQIRQEAGTGIKTAGPELGVTYSYLSKLENGLVSPSAELLDRMASYYGADRDYLFAAARKLPPDVIEILDARYSEAVEVLRRHFGRDDCNA